MIRNHQVNIQLNYVVKPCANNEGFTILLTNFNADHLKLIRNQFITHKEGVAVYDIQQNTPAISTAILSARHVT